MKLKSIIILSTFLAFATGVIAQVGNDPSFAKPEPPEKAAMRSRMASAVEKAELLASSPGKLEEGIAALRDALAMCKAFDKKYDGLSSSTSRAAHQLAKALTRAKRDDEAIAAYREAFRWRPDMKDLYSPSVNYVNDICDYAILLFKAGKYEESKAMYYYAMRGWGGSSYQYFPFLVVFEPDPTMTVWENTPDKLLSAIMMLRAIHTNYSDGQKDWFEEVRKREPAWILPLAYINDGSTREGAWIHQARPLATSEDERNWIGLYEEMLSITGSSERNNATRQVWLKLAKIAGERRKNSQALKQAKRDMERMHSRVAAPAPGQGQE